ncbi:MAG: glycosyltransferase family 2 protein, partial [Candidatus Nanohaloarchaea archaeon]
AERLKSIEGIRYFECDGGTAAARNKGAEAANSDRILFLDADCYPEEDWHDKMSEALEEYDLIEGEVEYVGERCPFSRIVENRGEKGRFLTANLGVRKEVFEEIKFDENYPIFREDTDFGIRVLQQGYSNSFCHAKVEHDAGKLTLSSFIKDQKRYETEAYFFKKFQGTNYLEQHLSRFGRVFYPKEFAATLALVALTLSILIHPILGSTALIGFLAALTTGFTALKVKNGGAKFCVKDCLKGMLYLPLGLGIKRYSLWKGGYKNKVLVI